MNPLPLRLRRLLVAAFCVSAFTGLLALDDRDFLAAAGPVIRADHGRGAIVDLRGTNFGGWLVHEAWMSPIGRGQLARTAWHSAAGALFDGDPATAVTLGGSGAANAVIAFGGPVYFDAAELILAPGGTLPEFSISNDGSAWTPVAVRESRTDGARTTVMFARECPARFLRLGAPASGATGIAELQLLQGDDYTARQTLVARFGGDARALVDGYQRRWITEADLDNLHAWGLNVVRVPLNWLDFAQEDGALRDDGFAILDWLLAACEKRGLYVILDMHAVPGGASPWASSGHSGDDGTGHNPNGFWDDPKCLETLARIWENIAKRYRERAVVAGYDLVNEPLYHTGELPAPGQTYSEAALRKSAMFDVLYRRIRAVDAQHLIFIAAYTSSSPDRPGDIDVPVGFEVITPPQYHGWENVVYQTHHYDMRDPHNRAAQERLVTRALADLERYQREWNVPVYAGEFSLYGFYDVWRQWLTGLNRLHISWSNWTYKVCGSAQGAAGPDWGFFNTNPSPAPDVVHDSREEIARKWTAFDTGRFARNDALISVVSECARARP